MSNTKQTAALSQKPGHLQHFFGALAPVDRAEAVNCRAASVTRAPPGVD
jgi:hypothetical protein